jgi:hypothetical protein
LTLKSTCFRFSAPLTGSTAFLTCQEVWRMTYDWWWMTDNPTFFCEQVLPSLVDDITSHGRNKILNGILIHLNDARPHNSELS